MTKYFALLSLVASSAFGQAPVAAEIPVTFSATPTFTATSAISAFTITLTSDVTSSTFSAPAVPTIGSLKVCQDSTGLRAFVAPSGSVGFGLIDSRPSKCSTATWKYDGSVLRATSPFVSDDGKVMNLPTRSACVDFGADNASDLVDADLGPQGSVFKIPAAATIIEVSVTSNAGTPSLPILQKNHWGGSSWAATDITSAVLPTGASGIETCAATGSACLSGVAKSGSVTVVTTSSANVVAAGDYIQTKTGSSFASSGAKRVTACVTYTVN